MNNQSRQPPTPQTGGVDPANNMGRRPSMMGGNVATPPPLEGGTTMPVTPSMPPAMAPLGGVAYGGPMNTGGAGPMVANAPRHGDPMGNPRMAGGAMQYAQPFMGTTLQGNAMPGNFNAPTGNSGFSPLQSIMGPSAQMPGPSTMLPAPISRGTPQEKLATLLRGPQLNNR